MPTLPNKAKIFLVVFFLLCIKEVFSSYTTFPWSTIINNITEYPLFLSLFQQTTKNSANVDQKNKLNTRSSRCLSVQLVKGPFSLSHCLNAYINV
jgi:hypothetical protein